MLVTGHPQTGGAGPDWDAIGAAAASGLTLVIYMGVTQAPRLVEQLLPRLGADWPAAAVQAASTPGQRQVRATLGTLVDTLAREQLGSPAVLVLGRVLEAAALAEWAAQAAPASRRKPAPGKTPWRRPRPSAPAAFHAAGAQLVASRW
jgi:uroporphyrin-III C-methyltransferase